MLVGLQDVIALVLRARLHHKAMRYEQPRTSKHAKEGTCEQRCDFLFQSFTGP